MKQQLIQDQSIEIPENLTTCVEVAIEEGMTIHQRAKVRMPTYRIAMNFAFSCSFLCILFLNISPTFAQTMHEIPVLGEVFQFLTFREYNLQDETYYIDVKLPQSPTPATPN